MGLVRRTGIIVLLATAISADAFAWGPPPAAPDLEGEIAWARATWPDVFRGVRFRVPLATLLAWTPRRGSIPAYLYREHVDGTRGSCDEVELERDRPRDDDTDAEELQTLTATIAGPPRTQRGRTVRNVSHVSIGDEMSQESLAITVQARDARGRWKFAEGTYIGEIPISYGWLSYADARVARWDAQPLRLQIECPVEWLDCLTGGGRSCQQCDRASVFVQETDVEILRLYRPKPRPAASCEDPCPPPTDGPDIARLRRLRERVQLWRPHRTPLARVSSLYRSLDDCTREHPPANRR